MYDDQRITLDVTSNWQSTRTLHNSRSLFPVFFRVYARIEADRSLVSLLLTTVLFVVVEERLTLTDDAKMTLHSTKRQVQQVIRCRGRSSCNSYLFNGWRRGICRLATFTSSFDGAHIGLDDASRIRKIYSTNVLQLFLRCVQIHVSYSLSSNNYVVDWSSIDNIGLKDHVQFRVV